MHAIMMLLKLVVRLIIRYIRSAVHGSGHERYKVLLPGFCGQLKWMFKNKYSTYLMQNI